MILASTIAAYVISIFVGTYTRFLAVFAKVVLHVGPDGMGLLSAAPGIGAALSPMVKVPLKNAGTAKRCCGFPPKRRRFC